MPQGPGGQRNSGNDLPLPDAEFSAEIAQQVQTFLQENLGIELNFVVGADGKTVVQVLDSSSGKVIRHIPPEKVPRFRDKMEKLRVFYLMARLRALW